MIDGTNSHWNFNDYDLDVFSLFPNAENKFGNTSSIHRVTSDWWVVSNNTLFDTQWIHCSYPISGGYGPTPRYLYYFLVIFALLMRRRTWVVRAALGSVVAYSSTAAIHAMVLAIIRTQLIPKYIVNYMAVLVDVQVASDTHGEDGDESNVLWLPVLPMAWDSDGDPVLAVVGTAFLVLLLMQLYSNTFKNSSAKSVLFLWSALLVAGVLCALINVAYLNPAKYLQLRFCPIGASDTLPLTNSGLDQVGAEWAQAVDPYYWDTTVREIFRNTTLLPSMMCVYPCFATSWSLRDPSEITVLDQSTGAPSRNTDSTLFILAYTFFCTSAVSLVTRFAITRASQSTIRMISKGQVQGARIASQLKIALNPCKRLVRRIFDPIRKGLPKQELELGYGELFVRTLEVEFMKYILITSWKFYMKVEEFYAQFLSLCTTIYFIVWIEWYLWTHDPPGESYPHVGQWGALVAAGVVFIGSFLGFLFNKPTRRDHSTQTNEPLVILSTEI